MWSLQPVYPLAIKPLTFFLLAISKEKGAPAMLFAINKLAFILSTIWPGEGALSFFHIVNITTYVCSSVTPNESSLSVHLTIMKVSCILIPLLGEICSFSMRD